MILFKKIRWKNLLSTGNIFTELDLLENKTTLIVGENGAGKSTILDALSFGLFNKPFRKVNKPQLLNSITKKDLVVEIEFQINQNNYKVVRGIKPNIFELYRDGKLLNQDAAARDYQEVLEKQILKINHKSFCQVVVLGSASFVPFMQLPAQSRREIIEDLLDLQIFTSMNLLLKEKVLTNSTAIKDCESDKKILKAKLDFFQKHLESVQTNNVLLIEEKQSKIDSTAKLIDDANAEIDEIISASDALKVKLHDQHTMKARLQKLDQLKTQLKSKIDNASKTINFFHDNDNCPTCKQGIDHDFKTETIKTKSTQITEVENGLNKLEEERLKVLNKLEEYSKINNDLHDLNLKLSQLNTKISGWNDNMREWTKEIKSIQEKSQTSQNVQDIEQIKKDLKDIEINFNELHDEKVVLATAASILKDGGIKSKIIKQYIPIINKFINKYLTSMDFFVNFELNEQFDETIKSRFRDEFSYASFSEGEKMRINLAILFTWRAISKLRNSINTNLLIMDEVFDSSLDSNGTDEFFKILQSLTADTNTFIISHKTDQLYDKFEKVVKFEKHKNFSKMAA
jgi:DNA repair exonuclease SbcCD ATPase subunit